MFRNSLLSVTLRFGHLVAVSRFNFARFLAFLSPVLRDRDKLTYFTFGDPSFSVEVCKLSRRYVLCLSLSGLLLSCLRSRSFDSAFWQRRAPLPIVKTQKSPWNVSDVDRRETVNFSAFARSKSVFIQRSVCHMPPLPRRSPTPEDPVDWAMAEASDGEDDAPMPDAPPEPEIIDLPPAPASAHPMSNLERCIALHLVYGAGPR